ncbi:hypothetical protein GCM10012320_32050 [Sinomonas cellulolyticus]|uniref:Uncharacterized protein n=1 Tax=Sinomonas cellulolyticus TaxID=2801916 RepID=A0ABS1JYF4_9MICC|nr:MULTISPECIES: hypothetical protein [Sinomonas]MBL0704223.1 hypothetical protein [Sinomonas cellulolyticus]GHG58352.1 hypothetical protein GCM10012320_32050 [Sinomonas sp. KCTC 49339]
MLAPKGLFTAVRRALDNLKPERDPLLPRGRETGWRGMEFAEAQRFRPFDLLPAAGQFFASSGESPATRHYIDTVPRAPFLTIELSSEGDPGAWEAGISTPRGTVRADYDVSENQVRLFLSTVHSERLLGKRVVAAGPARVALTFTENTVCLWSRDGGDWSVLVVCRLSPADGIDLRQADCLSASRLFWRGSFARARAGYFGYVGLRDPQLIRSPDGEPIRDGGRLWMTATCAGPGFFHAAHWAVFSFPENSPEELRLESHLFFNRDGRLLGDHAGFILRGEDGFLVGVSSWGDFDNNAHVRSAASQADILTGVHVLESRPWPLPTEYDAWDPSLIRHEGAWWLAFVECTRYSPRFTFRPVLAKTSPGAEWDGQLERVGADTIHQQTEGTLLTILDGNLYVLASDGDARDYPIYDLAMHRIDTLNAPYPTNIPHPLVVNPNDDPFILTFDGTPHNESELGYGTHGDIVVLRGRRQTA